jgi:hypothetical protein
MGQTMKTTSSKTTTRSKKRKELKDPFACFKQATAETFNFLVDDYGFEPVSTIVHAPECEIKYWNKTTGVTVTYEWGGVIWVDLSRLKRASAEAVENERYSLDILMLECCPDRGVKELQPSEEESSNQYVERVLPTYAKVLKKCGSDVLAGDFRIFPRLKKHAEEVLRQRNKELFGTETGTF